jgi:endonuclease-3
VILPTARRLFALARTPAELSHLIPAQIDEQIGTCMFHEAKARQIHQIACRVVVEYGGALQ